MATDPDALVVEFARELVNRVIKSSLGQVRGPVAWPSSNEFTIEGGRLAIEQLVAVRVAMLQLLMLYHLCRAGELVVAGGTAWTI